MKWTKEHKIRHSFAFIIDKKKYFCTHYDNIYIKTNSNTWKIPNAYGTYIFTS